MVKYIDAGELYKRLIKRKYPKDRTTPRGVTYNAAINDVLRDVQDAPAVDVQEVVRCKDCKYQNKGQNECESWNICEYRSWLYLPVNDEDFCSNGERR